MLHKILLEEKRI